MKNRKIGFLALFICLIFLSCKDKNLTVEHSPSDVLSNYLLQYNNQFIKSGDNIDIVFKENLIDNNLIGSTVENKSISITPKVNGKFIWKSPSIISFEHSDPLVNGEKYLISINVNLLSDTINSTNNEFLNLVFEVIPQSLSINFDPITYDDDNRNLILKGQISSNDVFELSDVKDYVAVKSLLGKTPTIEWKTISKSKADFKITDIEKGKSKSELHVTWKNTEIDKNFKGERKFEVPAENELYIMNAFTEGKNKIIVVCSEPLDRNQNIDGLIRINQKNASYNYEIEKNFIFLYLKNSIKGVFNLNIEPSIKSLSNNKLIKSFESSLSFEPLKPALMAERTGIIVPTDGRTIIPFKAKNLHFVDVEVFKVYANNVLQFLQYNNLNDDLDQTVVGKVVHEETIDLSSISNEQNTEEWVRYALDLNKFVKKDLGALYKVRIGFKYGYAKELACDDQIAQSTVINDGSYGLEEYGNDYSNYDYQERENPCHRSYYMSDRYIDQNILATNIGLIAKGGAMNKEWNVFATDLRKAGPINNVDIKLYDFQQQLIGEGKTDSEGRLLIDLQENPAFVIAENKGEFTYLNLQGSYSNSLSDFEVSGATKDQGIDGYIYGERGVWRPGDTMFLNFVLYNEKLEASKEHPITFRVFDAKGKLVYQSIAERNVGCIYSCSIPTQSNAPTGDWTAKVTVGNMDFTKSLKVETIKPNRIKIELKGIDKELNLNNRYSDPIAIEAKWLHGANANGLSVNIESEFSNAATYFQGFKDYAFDDPARATAYQSKTILDDKLDQNGLSSFKLYLSKDILPSGKLRARLKSRVYEKSGNFSEVYSSVNVSPYEAYVGIKIPKSKWGSNFIESEKDLKVPIVVVDQNGQPMKNRKLSIGLYQSEWSWWYNRSYNRMYEFNSSTHQGAIEKGTIETNNKGEAYWKPKLEGHGNYLVRVCDEESGHCTGSLFYSSTWGYAENDINSPKTFSLTTDKSQYEIGENIKINIPSNESSKILVTVEKSDGVSSSFWIDGQKDATEFKIKAEKNMFPNVYIHALLIQPYDEHSNDLPLRLYGVVPISVVDNSKKLEPEIKTPIELKPNESFEVNVSEKEGRSMYYTLALVDEGLLSLTNFKTPSPYDKFYSKQSLGLNTWDIYDFVASGYEKGILNAYSIGGDGVVVEKGEAKVNRFKPIVYFKGPFVLNKNETNTHSFEMGNYVGEVRLMVIGGANSAFGSAEKSLPVRQDLMVTSTLPRTLAPGESTSLGVNVFALNDNVKTVDLMVNSKGKNDGNVKYQSRMNFENAGDKIEFFNVDVGHEIGVKSFEISAQSGQNKVSETIDIEVKNPNPHEVKTIDFVIEKNDVKNIDYSLFGVNGTNEIKLQLYSLPSFNLEKRLQYLITYPYGCIEQTVSSAFAQLYLPSISDLSNIYASKIKDNINVALKKLSSFQKSNGSFSFWPGGLETEIWGSIYAGDFMFEAKQKGYFVSNDIYNQWLSYEKSKAIRWINESSSEDQLIQAYRLFVLAKSDNAELGAMNRLRKTSLKSSTAKYLLATAYSIVGQSGIGKELVKEITIDLPDYQSNSLTFGSQLRDESLVLLYHINTKNDIESMKILQRLSKNLSSNKWYSTQSTAMALLGISKYIEGKESQGLKGSFQNAGGGKVDFNTRKTTFTRPLLLPKNIKGNKSIVVNNGVNEKLFGQLIISGQPDIGKEQESSIQNIKLEINYYDSDQNKLDVNKLKQGVDFYAVINVKHLNTKPYDIGNLAMRFKMPSGWEVNNERMSGLSSFIKESNYQYKDIKDASVDLFFNLAKSESKQFVISLTASYAGKYYLPASICHSMYEGDIKSSIGGRWVSVINAE